MTDIAIVDESMTALAGPIEMGIVCPSSTIPGTEMNEHAIQLKDLIKGDGLTRAEAAKLLYISLDTLHKWLKPATTANRNPCTRWAVELLAYKTGQKIPPMPPNAIEATIGIRKRARVDAQMAVEPAPLPTSAETPRRARKAVSKLAGAEKSTPTKKRSKASA